MKTKAICYAALALALCACPPPIDTGEDGGFTGPITVGPEGGIFVRQGAVLDIPKNAVSTTVTIVLTVIDTGIPEVPDRKRISYGYRYSPSTLVFKAPVTLYLPWLEDRVPQAVDPGTFDMRRQQGADAYLQLPAPNTLTDLKAVSAQTDKLGLFWVTSPAQPNVARLEIDPTEVVLRVGDTQQFTAKVIDPTGAELPIDVGFTAVPARAANITDGGLLTATDPGTVTVTAHAADQTARATVHIQGATLGPQSFVHENPFPTGNDLWSGMVLPGNLGVVFVGANGTVLHQDASNAWTRLYSAPGLILKAVAGSAAGTAATVGVSGTAGVLIELAGTATPKTVILNNFDPRALWFDGTSGMAVGLGNDILVRKAGVWVRDDSPSFETLLSVVGDGAGGFVTVGSLGSIYKFDPIRKVWDSLYQTRLAVLLTAAQLANAAGTEAWAAGGNKLWHFTGSSWTALNLPASPTLTEVTSLAMADGRIMLSGKEGKNGWVFTWDPTGAPPDAGTPDPDGGTADGGFSPTPGWTAFQLRSPQIPRGIFGAGPASPNAYVVGDLGAVYQYVGGGTFTELSSGFYGDVVDVKIATGGEVFAAANACANPACTSKTGTVYHRTGPGQWAQLGGQSFGEIFSMTARSSTEVIVATVPAMYRWDGSAWAGLPVTGGVSSPIRAMGFCGSTLHGVGQGGSYYRGGATALSIQPSPANGTDLFGFHCANENELWAAGTGALISKAGSASWQQRTSSTIQQGPWKAVWSPGVGEAYTFGDARFGAYWNTEELQLIDAPGGLIPDVIWGLWGSSVDNLYAVGALTFPVPSGLALRFDGYQWRLVDSGAQRAITSIDGASNTEIWLGTAAGGVLHAVPP